MMGLIWAFIVQLFTHGSPQTCTASVFGYHGDKWGSSATVFTGRPVRPTDIGIAHRTIPLGTLVVLEYRGRYVVATVIDRGPYGALDASGRWFIKRRRSEPGRWRGCVDLTPRAARLLGHGGWGKVRLWRTRIRVQRRRRHEREEMCKD
jgi:hypothetical protein